MPETRAPSRVNCGAPWNATDQSGSSSRRPVNGACCLPSKHWISAFPSRSAKTIGFSQVQDVSQFAGVQTLPHRPALILIGCTTSAKPASMMLRSDPDLRRARLIFFTGPSSSAMPACCAQISVWRCPIVRSLASPRNVRRLLQPKRIDSWIALRRNKTTPNLYGFLEATVPSAGDRLSRHLKCGTADFQKLPLVGSLPLSSRQMPAQLNDADKPSGPSSREFWL